LAGNEFAGLNKITHAAQDLPGAGETFSIAGVED